MIETEQATPVKPTVDAVVEAALHRTLRVLARVSRQRGSTYDGPALLIARELFPDKVTVRTWAEVYGGHDWSQESWYDLAYYSGRGYAEAVGLLTLRDEYIANATVSRETVAPALTVTDARARTCTCDACQDSECTGTCSEEQTCDDHGCTQCHGDDYCCDDHDCEHCYSDHACCDLCEYCSECGSHQGDQDRDELCPNCSWCRQCDHCCNDY